MHMKDPKFKTSLCTSMFNPRLIEYYTDILVTTYPVTSFTNLSRILSNLYLPIRWEDTPAIDDGGLSQFT